jgi:release factor glutamine methyltransferase
MKNFIQKLAHPFYKRYHFWYHRKPRKYTYKDVYTIIQPGVFSPKNTVSTKVFLDYIFSLNLSNKKVLELGCGSGIMSVFSASQGAVTTASDINRTALDSLKDVSIKQGLKITTVNSDLFEKVNGNQFDYIFINPPYYPKNPFNLEEKAWFCGENFEFFEKMFFQLKEVNTEKVKALMILSDACELKKIRAISLKNGMNLTEIHSVDLTFERNNIYQIN